MTLDGCGSKSPRAGLKPRPESRGCRNRAGECGAELVEFALVLTTLLLFLFGIMDFGRALYAYHFVSNAAREGTRYAIVRGSACKPRGPACPAGKADISDYIAKFAPPGIDISSRALNVTTTWNPDNNPGSVVKVQVQYNFSFFFPFLPTAVIAMNSSSEMVISQ